MDLENIPEYGFIKDDRAISIYKQLCSIVDERAGLEPGVPEMIQNVAHVVFLDQDFETVQTYVEPVPALTMQDLQCYGYDE